MYSDKRNILQLAALLRAHRVNDIVICPGSRNAPLAATFVRAGFNCRPVTDERSAGFFAIGISISDEKPVAVCCTSGTALANLYSAVAEAYYQQVPLIIISADRPAAWIGQMDGQTMPQPGIFGSLVKMSVNLPEVRSDEDEWYCNRLINEAILETSHHGFGPVHINVPVSEPLFNFDVTELPKVRTMVRYQGLNVYDRDYNELINRMNRYTKKMIVVGQMNLIYLFEKRYCKQLYKHFAWLSEHISNRTIPGLPIKNFDAVLYAMDKNEMPDYSPELLITYGGHIISKRLKNFLRNNPPKEHWHISEDGKVADLFGVQTVVIEMSPFEFLEKIATLLESKTTDFPRKWENMCKALPKPNFAYSEMAAIGKLISALPDRCALHLANSSAVRYAQLFDVAEGVEVCSNRGMNGIDGSLSTAVGYSTADRSKPNFVVIGDLSFFYDMNGLWNSSVWGNLRILLLNNGGGEIFHALPGLDMDKRLSDCIAANHSTKARGWAEEAGFDYVAVHNEDELDGAIATLVRPVTQSNPVLVEVFTDSTEDVRLLKEYYKLLKHKI